MLNRTFKMIECAELRLHVYVISRWSYQKGLASNEYTWRCDILRNHRES